MKKTEMIEKLRSSINFYTEVDTVCSSNAAANILEDLEKEGMLPPLRDRTEEEKDIIDAINESIYIRKWEDEKI